MPAFVNGFGRGHVASLISRLVRKHPQGEVQLQLSFKKTLCFMESSTQGPRAGIHDGLHPCRLSVLPALAFAAVEPFDTVLAFSAEFL